MTRNRTRRPGFTLIEMSVVMFGLVVVMGAGVAVLLATQRAERAGAATAARVGWRTALADQFRADVAGADAAPDAAGPLKAGPNCLILHVPADGLVAYVWKDDRLDRVDRPGAKDEFRRPVPTGTAAVSFARTPGDRPLVTLKLTDTPAHGPARSSDVAAALGGDLR